MNVSRPVVHPIEAPPVPQPPAAAGAAVAANNNNNDDANNQNIPWMKDIQGMPGTPGGLALRLLQFVFAAAALCVMVTTSDFTSVTAFCYLVAVAILQSSWSLSLAFVDVYAIMVGRSLRNPRVVCLFTVGDGITSTLTFAAACASAGITVLIDLLYMIMYALVPAGFFLGSTLLKFWIGVGITHAECLARFIFLTSSTNA